MSSATMSTMLGRLAASWASARAWSKNPRHPTWAENTRFPPPRLLLSTSWPSYWPSLFPLAKGLTTVDVVRKLGITEQTYYRWRKEFGGLRMDQAKRLKELEKENSRLKKLLAEQALDNAILKEVSSGNF